MLEIGIFRFGVFWMKSGLLVWIAAALRYLRSECLFESRRLGQRAHDTTGIAVYRFVGFVEEYGLRNVTFMRGDPGYACRVTRKLRFESKHLRVSTPRLNCVREREEEAIVVSGNANFFQEKRQLHSKCSRQVLIQRTRAPRNSGIISRRDLHPLPSRRGLNF